MFLFFCSDLLLGHLLMSPSTNRVFSRQMKNLSVSNIISKTCLGFRSPNAVMQDYLQVMG